MEGDAYLSSQDRHIWSLIWATMQKFHCIPIFRKSGPWAPAHQDCWLHFFVPCHHPRANEVVEYLEHETRALLKVRRQRKDDWHPNTFVRVFLYSGIDPYMERDISEDIAQIMHDSFLASMSKEIEDVE